MKKETLELEPSEQVPQPQGLHERGGLTGV